jgi:hypothetical protein
MSKRSVMKWSQAGFVAMVWGLVLLPSSVGALAVREPAFDVGDDYGRVVLALLVFAVVLTLTGAILGLVGWWRAVGLTAAQGLTSWHRALLWGGVIGIVTMPIFGLGVLFFGSVVTAYLVCGPDRPGISLLTSTPSKRLTIRRAAHGGAIAGGGTMLAVAAGNLSHPGLPLHGLIWPTLALVSLGFAVTSCGAVIVFAAWWGALFNAYLLPDQTWFRRLRWTGVLAAVTMPVLGLGAVVVAVALGAWARRAPDGTATMTPVETLTPTLRKAPR